MQKNQLKYGSFLSYVQMFLSVIIGLIYTPIIIHYLGQSEYGLYNTVTSTISMLSILSFGFNSGYFRYYAKYRHNKDESAIYRLNGLFFLILSLIGLVSFFCGIYLSHHLNIVFKEGLTDSEYRLAYVLMIILTVNLSVSFPMSAFQNIISAHEEFVFLKIMSIIRTVLSPMLTLPLLIMGYRSIALVSMTCLVTVFVDVCYFIFVKVKLKNKFYFHGLDQEILKGVFKYTVFIAIHLVVDQINWNIDKVLLGRFKGTAVVAIYSVGFNLYYDYIKIITAISGVFLPRIHIIYNTYKNKPDILNTQFTELFTKVGRIQYLILGLIGSGFFFWGKDFIRFWAGEEYSEAYYVALLLIISGSIDVIQNIGIEIQRAENKHMFRGVVYLIMAIINLMLTVYLSQLYGAIGAAIGTALSLIIGNGIVINIYYYKYCGIDVLFFWKNICKMSCGYLIPICIGFVIVKTVRITTFFDLVLVIGCYTFVFAGAAWAFSMNKFEKNLIRRPIRRLFRKH